MNAKWITDRMPTAQDCHAGYDDVWVYDENYKIVVRGIRQSVWRGLPWQPIQAPAPYVKPKRWTVDFSEYDNTWIMRDNVEGWTRLLHIDRCHADAAQRIADIYNEVKP